MTVTINGTTGYTGPIGAIGDLSTTGNTTLGDAAGDTLTINGSTTTFTQGTANGVAYLNGSKVLTTGSALTFDGTTFATTAVASFAAGSASAPALTRTGDTNTGIFFPAADTIAFAEGGVECARFDSNGNFGLGATPSAWGIGRAMQIGAASGAFQFGQGGQGIWGVNAYYDTSWKYAGSAPASYYQQLSGVHSWNTAASGTAGNAITFTQAMTLDASGNLGLGITSPVGLGSGIATLDIGGTNGGGLRFRRSGNSAFLFADGSGVDLGTNDSVYLRFITAATERARIDSSGNLLFRTTSSGSGNTGWAFLATANSNFITTVCGSLIDGATHLSFQTAGVQKGYIAVSGGSTIYSTSSDYRLKENIAPMTGALNKVMQLKPVTYRWIQEQVDSQGFIAHELQEVVPQCVMGEKDAVDEDGNPVYQGIDTSFLVATLTAAIQELKAEFDQYKLTHP